MTTVGRDETPLRWNERRGRWQRWSGRGWRSAVLALDPAGLRSPLPFQERPSAPGDLRAQCLSRAVDEALLNGASLLKQDQFSAILGVRRPVHHGFHLVMTLLTGGLWAVIWVVMALTRGEDRVSLTVDPWGHVWAFEGRSTA